ncbi:MAG: FtsQ-type POTRA domain-containing protein [Eubacterium sp.]|nr:FtsQ-type POTRA domain-containing protein [Eubacterium sp.]
MIKWVRAKRAANEAAAEELNRDEAALEASEEGSLDNETESDETIDEEIYRRIALKHVERNRKKHKKKHYLLKFLIFLTICAAIFLFLKSSYFNITAFSVEGNNYYTDQEVLNMAKAKKNVNIIFAAGISDIKKNLAENPYFEEITVKRNFPNKLTITVKERAQTAAIAYGESFIVIDQSGTILRKANVDPQVTLLTGLTISKMNIGEPVEVEESDSLKMTLRMLSAMNKGDIFFKKIDVSKVVIRAYIYDSLLVKGTPAEVMSTIKSGELQKVVNNLFDEKISRGTIKVGGSDYMSFTPEIDN